MRIHHVIPVPVITWLLVIYQAVSAAPNSADPRWDSAHQFRVILAVDGKGHQRSNSPATVEIDFQKILTEHGVAGRFDENSVEVVPSFTGGENRTLPHVTYRLERLFGASRMTLHFTLPDSACTNVAVYFDAIGSGRGNPRRYGGLVGDGDRFRQEYGRRAVAASHFDCFADLDGDGDLDLFQGGVEPYVYCYENQGQNYLVERGRLSSGGRLFKMPCSRSNRSWLTVAFHDLDGDGDAEFVPSFGDGPDAGQFICYRNDRREKEGQLDFVRTGPLRTESGVLLAGGAQAGGWFPSIAFVRDWNGAGIDRITALVGSKHRCWLYQGLGTNSDGAPRFAEPIALRAGGREIELTNPRFDCADIDNDGDLDLFAGTQPGAVLWFKNVGTTARADFAAGQVVAWDGNYLIGDAHSGITLADFDRDGLIDVMSGRFWERTDLRRADRGRDFGGFFKNSGTRSDPRFEKWESGAPFTEGFQACDAIRQNSVRAVDWNDDGQTDLLAGDTDGFIWFFRRLATKADSALETSSAASTGIQRRRPLTTALSRGGGSSALFAPAIKLRAGGELLSVSASGGHARFDTCDWNNDGQADLVVADGQGTLTLFLHAPAGANDPLLPGQRIIAEDKPIQMGSRASALVCDWNNDGRKDLVLADDKGYYFCANIGSATEPKLSLPKPVSFGGKPVSYVRPNLGSFVDWDGDGKRDLIGCHFENSIRFYRNIGSGNAHTEPQFADSEGIIIVQAESPQMISGADVTDWNGDGDLDILTGQGHGGSGLRFYERDWIEDELHQSHPKVVILGTDKKP